MDPNERSTHLVPSTDPAQVGGDPHRFYDTTKPPGRRIDWDAVYYSDGPTRSIIDLDEAIALLTPKSRQLCSLFMNQAYMLYFGVHYACGMWIVVYESGKAVAKYQVAETLRQALIERTEFLSRLNGERKLEVSNG